MQATSGLSSSVLIFNISGFGKVGLLYVMGFFSKEETDQMNLVIFAGTLSGKVDHSMLLLRP